MDIGPAAAAVQHNACTLSPDPQAQEPRSLWTEVWPTQPVVTTNIDHSGNTPGRSSAKRGGREGAVLGPGPHALNAASGKRGVYAPETHDSVW